MINLTPTKLIDFVKDYDYEINNKQAKDILIFLEDNFGIFSSENIEMATDYVINGEKSIFARYF